MTEWTTLRIDQFAEVITGTTPKASDVDSWGDCIDFVTPSDQWGAREAAPARRLSAEGARRLRKKIVPPRSTALTCIGATIGKVSMSINESVTNQQINSLVAKPGVADSDFIYYLIRGWSAALGAAATGSATPIVNKSTLSAFEFSVPELSTQVAIGGALGALDDKIAENRRVVSSLERLRKTLWGRASQGAGESPLSSHAQFVNGGAYTKGATGVGRVVVRIAELNSGIGSSTVYNDLDVPDRQIAHAGDLLMSWSGSLTAVRWYREDAIVNQHIFKVIPRDDVPVWAVACAVETKLAEFREIAAGKATTMGHIKRADLDSPVAWPEISDRLNDAGTALWDRALAAEKENLRLATTRDELLPLLMAGKITVKDAEKTVEEVV